MISIRQRLFSFGLFSYLILCAGCQQTQLNFTAVQSPTPPEFTPLNSAPKLAEVQPEQEGKPAFAPKVSSLDKQHHIHLLPGVPSALNRIHLVAVSPNKPYANIDILSKAFSEKALWLANQTSATTADINCANSFNIQARQHSISLSFRCEDDQLTQAVGLLATQWATNSFDNLDIAKLRRTLALNKHINAFSGNEIEQVWAEKVLGKTHPYNQSVNDTALQQQLTLSDLNRLRQQAVEQSQWHLIIERDNDISTSDKQKLELHLAQLDSVATRANGYQDDFRPYGKTLFVIDAPNSVQTQVRVGYHLFVKDDTSIQCQQLSLWLGRSFSGRLYYDLREQRGLTYGIYGHCFDNPLSRTLKYFGSTQLQHTGAFIRGILDHFALATERMAPQREVNALKQYYLSQQSLLLDDPSRRSQRYIELLTQSRQWQSQLEEQSEWQALSPARLQQAAQQQFGQIPVIVIRGDLDKIKPDLQAKLPDWQITLVSPQ
ncbi:insulinase family protein [Shewanella sp. Isolate11]|uniref:insulinase family protein n=1 Tax=Shewanella sp. Isolate11 TaxID=2908530 RepID=UPI001EFEB7D4|nr:insulinase family protein [Shewanella sp. Isolate11]MCG9697562.1 insulinase family protein [Shewanella sp. Isolate11]